MGACRANSTGEPLGGRFPDEVFGEHCFAVEVEVALKVATLDEAWKPVGVVGPHFFVGNGVERSPEREGLVGLDEVASEAC